MTSDILIAAGIPFRRSRFPQPAEGTYAVYTDDISADGADQVNCILPTASPWSSMSLRRMTLRRLPWRGS